MEIFFTEFFLFIFPLFHRDMYTKDSSLTSIGGLQKYISRDNEQKYSKYA